MVGRFKYIVFVLVFVVQSTTAQKSLDALLQQYNTRSIPYISVEGLRALQTQQDIILLDTRENSEYTVSCIQGAMYVGFNNFSVKKVSEALPDKDAPIVVYCSLGIRSEEIGEKLKKAGYTNVKNLYGGIFEWKNKGYTVVNAAQQETDSVHVFSKQWGKWFSKGIPVYSNEPNKK